jgi:hypothetical protein
MATAGERLTGGFLAPSILSPEGEKGSFTVTELDPPGGHDARTFTGSMMTAPVVVAGYGGWSRIARPRRMALTEWVGRDALSVAFDFILDDLAEGLGLYVESQCQILEELAGVEEGDPEPPLLRLESSPEPLMPHGQHRASDNRWFIESLVWNQDQVRYNNAGNRVRAQATITLTVFSEDERLSAAATARKNAAKKGGKRKTYTVRAGDTLQKIAARKDVYGDSKKWKKIATANKIRDPKHLKKGQVLKIP